MKNPNNKIVIAFFTLLLAEAFALGFAWVFPSIESFLQVSANDKVLKLQFPSLYALFDFSPPKNLVTDSVVKQLLTSQLAALQDSSSRSSRLAELDSLTLQTDTFSYNIVQNPEIDGFYALDYFYESLANVAEQKSGQIRIAHYGDSQIEGDRITQFLREYFQRQFGGDGLGYIPFQEPASCHGYTRHASGNWRRYTVFKDNYINNAYGLSGCVFRFQKPIAQKDFENLETEKMPELSANYKLNLSAHVRYQQVNLAYGQTLTPCYITASIKDSIIYQDSLPIGSGFNIKKLPLPANSPQINLNFKSLASPDLYALMLDGNGGVQVDNYALRGHSGNGLLKIQPDFLSEQIAKLNTKLIILQFGGNVVPYPNVKEFKWLEDAFVEIIQRYKRVAPNASILIVGVSDAGHKTADGVQSYPTVHKIRDAQRNAALKTHCAFWDLYEVMGGENSIVSWVNQNPALAGEDYAHFSYWGQKLVGKLMFSALMKEYKKYLKRREISNQKIAQPTLPNNHKEGLNNSQLTP